MGWIETLMQKIQSRVAKVTPSAHNDDDNDGFAPFKSSTKVSGDRLKSPTKKKTKASKKKKKQAKSSETETLNN